MTVIDDRALGDETVTESLVRDPVEERRRRLRGRNYAVLAALLALVVLFYVITLVRMGGQAG